MKCFCRRFSWPLVRRIQIRNDNRFGTDLLEDLIYHRIRFLKMSAKQLSQHEYGRLQLEQRRLLCVEPRFAGMLSSSLRTTTLSDQYLIAIQARRDEHSSQAIVASMLFAGTAYEPWQLSGAENCSPNEPTSHRFSGDYSSEIASEVENLGNRTTQDS